MWAFLLIMLRIKLFDIEKGGSISNVYNRCYIKYMGYQKILLTIKIHTHKNPYNMLKKCVLKLNKTKISRVFNGFICRIAIPVISRDGRDGRWETFVITPLSRTHYINKTKRKNLICSLSVLSFLWQGLSSKWSCWKNIKVFSDLNYYIERK